MRLSIKGLRLPHAEPLLQEVAPCSSGNGGKVMALSSLLFGLGFVAILNTGMQISVDQEPPITMANPLQSLPTIFQRLLDLSPVVSNRFQPLPSGFQPFQPSQQFRTVSDAFPRNRASITREALPPVANVGDEKKMHAAEDGYDLVSCRENGLSREEQINRLDSMYDRNPISGKELRELVQSRWGRLYDTRILASKDSVYLQVLKNRYLGENSFPLTQEEYNAQLDAVASLISKWGCAEQVRLDIPNCAPGTDTGMAVMLKLNAPRDATGVDMQSDALIRDEPNSLSQSGSQLIYHQASKELFPSLNFAPLNLPPVEDGYDQALKQKQGSSIARHHVAKKLFPSLNFLPLEFSTHHP